MYATLSLGLHNMAGSKPQYIWYETTLFDAKRSMVEAVFVDTISGNGIIHGFLGKDSTKSYSSQQPGSADSANLSWTGFRHFDFTVSAAQLVRGITNINDKFKFDLRSDPAEWALGHFNVELEGTGDAAIAAHSMKGIRISVTTL